MKKDPNRFCTRFSDEDPIHFRAMDILERKGRKKADFIAKSVVLHDVILEQVASGQQLSPDVHFVLLQLLQSTSMPCRLSPLTHPASESTQPFGGSSVEMKGKGIIKAEAAAQSLTQHTTTSGNGTSQPQAHRYKEDNDIIVEESELYADDEAAMLGALGAFGED